MIGVLLAACELLPPPELGECTYLAGGFVSVFECDAYWHCDGGSVYAGEVYATDGLVEALRDPVDVSEATRLWCDRCGWSDVAGDPPAMFDDVLAACAWSSP